MLKYFKVCIIKYITGVQICNMIISLINHIGKFAGFRKSHSRFIWSGLTLPIANRYNAAKTFHIRYGIMRLGILRIIFDLYTEYVKVSTFVKNRNPDIKKKHGTANLAITGARRCPYGYTQLKAPTEILKF